MRTETPEEPLIKLKIGPQSEEITFLVDTGASRSTVRKLPPGCSVSSEHVPVVGVKGEAFQVPVIKNVQIELDTRFGLNDLLLIPEADNNLLGRDLIVALGIHLKPCGGQLKIYSLTEEDNQEISDTVWYSGEVGKLNIQPISIEIQNPEIPIRVKQYPISLESRRGLKSIIEKLKHQGILEPCMSPHNTPVLPVKKPDGSYRLAQDLRAVNQRTITRFPVVANPYTLLSQLAPNYTWYSVVDLKDAFWTCPLDENSQDYFAFEWEDPDTGRREQLRWTVIPQGFTESPNLFGRALEDLLKSFELPEGIKLLQYVDDLLLAGETEEDTRKGTIKLLNFLGENGLKISKSKLQFVESEVRYLGHWISKGRKKLDPEKVSGILNMGAPKSRREIRQFLGLLGYCRQWIEGFSGKVKFLYEKLTTNHLKWTEKDQESFKQVKEALLQAPVLSLPDLDRPFQLFVNTTDQTAYGVLTQDWAGSRKPVRYYSKLLDPVSKGWPTCLQALVAIALLVEEARKVTFGAPLEVYTPHNIRGILAQKAEKWLTDG